MNALILAAGLGTRLRPYTEKLPKPLFPIAGTTLLDTAVSRLAAAGCQKIVINTHHLADQIHAHIDAHDYPVPIAVSHEPEILGTGGAVQKASQLLGSKPFWVVNSDITHDIPLAAVYAYHLQHPHPATLVLVNDPDFNTVWLDVNENIRHFRRQSVTDTRKGRWLTFTGIQLVDPRILEYIPSRGFYSIIDAYRSLIQSGFEIRGCFVKKANWLDVGTPDRFQRAVRRKIASTLLKQNKSTKNQKIRVKALAGDGSDRRWSRLSMDGDSVILCEHGITIGAGTQEIDAFSAIGTHLTNRGISVPTLLHHDRFSGQVYLEDLGDTHLQDVAAKTSDPATLTTLYAGIFRRLFQLATDGANGFDPAWAYQTPYYDKDVILEKECRYFLEAFVNDWCGQNEKWATYAPEFETIADVIETHAIQGLLHRDMQSRNIMMKAPAEPYFIDFQDARLGPVQYDLASLLIDPYVVLSHAFRSELTHMASAFYVSKLRCDPKSFNRAFAACALSRNLQILGAFAYLTLQKGKTAFARYIPKALEQLQSSLAQYTIELGDDLLPRLRALAARLKRHLPESFKPV